MKHSIFDLPKEIVVEGGFDKECFVEISGTSIEALESGKLKVSIKRHGGKKLVNNFHLNLASANGVISIFVGNDGSSVSFGEGSYGSYDIRLWRGGKVSVGDGTSSNGTMIVCDNSGFITGSDCMFSGGVLVQTADQHGVIDLSSGEIVNDIYSEIVLGDHVWLGRNSTLMPGVEVGSGSIVGAGSIVTKSLEDKVIAAGVPARVVRKSATWSRHPSKLDSLSKEYIDSFCKEGITSV
ncbi:acyltransferase [Microbulbifer variabilis]|uniref:acyltransferase n=1 Tax=Microbulbifer variabilis TaxID=266805 RepID=UPI001CFE84FA|nr:acyltransferase [Microbulbifer variabilis]